MRLLFGLAAAALMSTPVGAADPKPQSADKLICKRIYDADTGSHFTSSKRVCRTSAEWKELEDGNARTMRTLRDNGGANFGGLSAPGPGGGPQ